MLSGNGRHRRPRQAPALLVAAGVTGSAIAIPLLAASGASAATGTTWDRVAECESGGSWSANDGNGYYGGLQMSQENWEKYGGLEYAKTADLASRNQQIAVAEKLLADQGIAAWPTCGLLSGLSKDSSSAGVDTGVGSGTPSPSESGSSESSGSSNSSGSADSSETEDSPGLLDSLDGSAATPSPSATPSNGDESASKSGKSAPKGPEASAKESAQPSDGSPVVSAEEDEADKSWQEGGSSALVDVGALGSGKHRGDSAEEVTTKSATPSAAPSGGRHAARTYTVQEGDSLASIADSLGLDGGWRALYAENKDRIGADPSNISAGQTLDTGAE